MSGTMPGTLQELFAERDAAFNKATEQIRGYLTPTLEGLEEFFKIDTDAERDRFSWQVFEIDPETNELLLVGSIKYKPGEKLFFQGQPIEVTEENAPLLERVIRVILPITLADKQSKMETIKHMEKVVQQSENDAFQAEQIASSMTAVSPEDRHISYDFDLDQLTDEQKEKLYLTTGFKID